jgi:hypothetical protein
MLSAVSNDCRLSSQNFCTYSSIMSTTSMAQRKRGAGEHDSLLGSIVGQQVT